MILVFVGANASENPFSLRENLNKIDQDQEVLLSELRERVQKKEAAEFSKDSERENKNFDDLVISAEVAEVKEQVSSDTSNAVKKEDQEAKRQKEVAEKRVVDAKAAEEKEARLKAKQAEAEKIAAQKSEKERQEKEKLEKLAQEKRVKAKKSAQEKREPASASVADSNMTPEELEAQRAYEEAVKEMDQED